MNLQKARLQVNIKFTNNEDELISHRKAIKSHEAEQRKKWGHYNDTMFGNLKKEDQSSR